MKISQLFPVSEEAVMSMVYFLVMSSHYE